MLLRKFIFLGPKSDLEPRSNFFYDTTLKKSVTLKCLNLLKLNAASGAIQVIVDQPFLQFFI